ncbi:PRC-barrel domain-containing protein [Candidatus Leptofilum sp.]|uniref:PRC-barrel domain-containing protein n=1 Tax=Candidatus Leptofilum sp. TaxID=3241576 RepID=UPI003B5AACDC
MRLGKDLVGKQIISITDGRSLGNAKDIYMNSELTDVTGIYLGSEGLIKRKHFLINRGDVVVFGIDAILVRNSDVVGEENEMPETVSWVRLSKLNKREIDTPGGTKVANIGDIILGEQGNITGFALSRVYVEGPIEKNGTIPRTAVIDTGGDDGVMTVDLTKAENPGAVEEKAPADPVPAPLSEEPEEIEIIAEPADEPAPEEAEAESETEEEASE